MNRKEKQVQIPESLFIEICKYFLLDVDVNADKIKKGLSNKLEAITRHDLYTKYKTATLEQQEQARKEYLEKIGISDDFEREVES